MAEQERVRDALRAGLLPTEERIWDLLNKARREAEDLKLSSSQYTYVSGEINGLLAALNIVREEKERMR